MKRFAELCLLGLLTPVAWACDNSLVLQGVEAVKGCDPKIATCVSAYEAVYQYAEDYPDTDADIVIAMPSSPWHFYDGDGRIFGAEEMAEKIRPFMTDKATRVVLLGSWTGGAPGQAGPSLAKQVSKALDGFPVEGIDGFLWLNADGGKRVTRQAHTLRQGAGHYQIVQGSEVLVPLVHGWASGLEDRFIERGDTGLLRHAAMGWEVFYLCPDGALAGFELAAKHGDAVGAYNAAILRLERASEGDRAAAVALLKQAAGMGDEKAQAKLAALTGAAQP